MNTLTTTRRAGPRSRLALLMLAGGIVGALGAGTASAAAAEIDVPSLVVRYSNLSLATDDGVSTLYRRLVFAAKEVCPEQPFRSLRAQTMVQECRAHAVSRAVEQIHNTRLAELHATSSKNG